MAYESAGILYHPRVAAAQVLAESLRADLSTRLRRAWTAGAWDPVGPELAHGTDLLICIGGDGTMLRAARIALTSDAPVIGVNMGRLGFLTELSAEDAARGLHEILDGAGRIELRTMLQSAVTLPGNVAPSVPEIALNDVAVGRYGGRPVDLAVLLDGVQVEIVRADSIVVSTATGSTGYNLSAGGPVLCPEERSIILTPVAAHVSRVRPIVLPADTRVELQVHTDLHAIVSFDGQMDLPLPDGSRVDVRRAERVARFIRLGPPSDFFRNLTQLLDAGNRGPRRE